MNVVCYRKKSIIIATLILWPTLLFAQDRSDKFYEKNYANSPLADVTKEGDKTDKEFKVSPPPGFVVPEDDYEDRWIENKSESSGVMDVAEGEQVTSIGAVINGEDYTHAESALIQLREVSDKFRIPLDVVFYIGGINYLVKSKSTFPIIERGANVKVRDKPPTEFPVKLSPTWLLHTAKGIYMLEGTGPLDKSINQRGRFVALGKEGLKVNKRPKLKKPEVKITKDEAGKLD